MLKSGGTPAVKDRIDALFPKSGRSAGAASAAFRAEMERAAVAEVKARGAVPPVCGPDIPVAPARGAFRVFRPVEIVPGSRGAARDAGYQAPGEDRPRRGMALADVFDRMEEVARRAWVPSSDDAVFVPPFSPGQVQIGRDYRDMTERHSAGGMRCASLETAGRGSGGGGSFIDAFLSEGRILDAMVARIGSGSAMAVRRIRPSARGVRASVITDRALVDWVCLRDKDLSWVLRRYGWAANARHRAALRTALQGALDRMMGYDLQRDAK